MWDRIAPCLPRRKQPLGLLVEAGASSNQGPAHAAKRLLRDHRHVDSGHEFWSSLGLEPRCKRFGTSPTLPVALRFKQEVDRAVH